MLFFFSGLEILLPVKFYLNSFDIKGNSWSIVRTQLMKPRAEHSALVTHNKIFIVGGASKAGSVMEVEIYDPETNRWKFGTDFPDERKVLNAVVYDGNILVCGGVREFHRANKPVRRVESKDMYEYDVMEKKWTKKVRMVQYANLQACAMVIMNTTFLQESDFVSTSEIEEKPEVGITETEAS